VGAQLPAGGASLRGRACQCSRKDPLRCAAALCPAQRHPAGASKAQALPAWHSPRPTMSEKKGRHIEITATRITSGRRKGRRKGCGRGGAGSGQLSQP
jgi:hypothetical protein